MRRSQVLALTFAASAGFVCLSNEFVAFAQSGTLDPQHFRRIGTVDERFQSYNIEMVEVIGGRFWKPYSAAATKSPEAVAPPSPGAVGIDPNLYQKRTPIDLGNPVLRKLALGLAPAYVRVSGTWANTTYFHDSDTPVPAAPPQGFNGVLTRAEWKGVVDFSKAVDAPIVTSVATSAGVRTPDGTWQSDQAKSLFEYTSSLGGHIAATEFMNEPTFAFIGGAPKGYDAAAYGRDLAVFKPFLRREAAGTLLLGPGSVGEGGALGGAALPGMLATADLLRATGDIFDDFSYHFYGAVSQRCAPMGAKGQTSAEAALSSAWLQQTDQVEAFYAKLRDTYAPGKPIWLTETGDAACGGNPWASTFTDSFRYLHQLGSLARSGVKVVMHNTLAASDYGLIDEATLTPRPNYWAAFLWSRFMGAGVLEVPKQTEDNLYVYSHCLRGHPGGVAILVINADAVQTRTLASSLRGERMTLSAAHLSDHTVLLNGNPLSLTSTHDVPHLQGVSAKPGSLSFSPETISFIAVPQAANSSCR